MHLFVIGLNHRTAPVEMRERFAVPPGHVAEVLADLRETAGLRESVLLSTCNRVELYAATEDAGTSQQAIREYWKRRLSLRDGELDCLYTHRDEDCARHLIAVACGLDSMVLGETEIFGQVKLAYETAHEHGATGKLLNRLFQKTFTAAKHIRSATAISRGSTSVGNVAVDLAGQIFRELRERVVMVVGTGEMSEATARALHSRGVRRILVCSRTAERAAALANELGGTAISYDQWPAMFPQVDIVISATAAPHPIITVEKLAPLMKARGYRPLFLIDIAVPRDVERACERLEGVYLYDIDDLQQIAQQNLAARERELAECRRLVAWHAARFMEWFERQRGSALGPCAEPVRT
ncbi:MAG: glutamyl-tRNA reductase [Verrucomicrobiae bacterium]|nr:glutamyl-tRNA reductase [Verrucomicrobiae bacterium]